ncbi:CARDB domain-containing protein [Myxococcus sp. RHSTA-1-4]|uniref:CARDB domain-containing protein n=1 Tax=Myxococcus sp. RHSTA-1-4 TaxID=2874601 RepID=UPI001CBC4A79|nr:CARDB domain-containing protein [Myxococcus sp. RHSTA-1-4]MBZ4422977.1 hypothetical protein [Myxococcus sp. RHSTA-1-4]
MRCITGLAAWTILSACGESSMAPEAAPPEAAAQALSTGPDFVVTSVTNPTSMKPDQMLAVTVSVCNQGTEPGGAFVELYLSPDSSIGLPPAPSEIPLGSTYLYLGAGDCRTQWAYGRSAVSIAGTYTVAAIADPANQLAETNESNNTRLGTRIGVGYLPDLVVSTLKRPTTAMLNQRFTASVLVCNQGTEPGDAFLELYLSKDPIITPPVPPSTSTDVPVGGVSLQPLLPGECRTEPVEAWANVPTEGVWYLGAAVDPTQAVPELFENNNISQMGLRMSMGSMPDLAMKSVTAPTGVLPGRTFTVTATVCNEGTQPGSAPVEWYLSEDSQLTLPPSANPDVLLGTAPTPLLQPGECQTLTHPASTDVQNGVRYVIAVVDGANGLPELIEYNNRRTGDRLGFGERPDFVVTSVTRSGTSPATGLIHTSVRVCNQGTTEDSTEVELYLSTDTTITQPVPPGTGPDLLMGREHVDPLGPGQCRTVTVNGAPPDGPEGTYSLGAIVDPYDMDTELIENNNTLAGERIGVGYRPDFVVTSITGPASALNGQSVDYTATVCNQGSREGHAEVSVYLSADTVITPAFASGDGPDILSGHSPLDRLEPGQCQTVTIPGFMGVPMEGTYYLGAAVDTRQFETEQREDNNTWVGNRIGVGYRPDFVVTSVTGPGGVEPHQQFNASVTVCNQGTEPGYTEVELFLSADEVITPAYSYSAGSDRPLGHAMLDMLAPGQCQTVLIPVQTGEEGAWYLGAAVDPRGMATELIKDNNTRVGYRIGLGYRPDFVVTSVTGPASIQRDESFSSEVQVCNQGTMGGHTSVGLYLSEDSVISASVPSGYPSPDPLLFRQNTDPLSPGQCQTLTLYGQAEWTLYLYGPLYLGAVVDPEGYDWELRKDNNTGLGRINVLP